MPPNTSKLADHKIIAEVTVLLVALIFLSGCTLFEGRGKDKSTLTIDHRCDVELSQVARVSGMDDADVVEKVTVMPDCTTEVEFRQNVGDTIKALEARGGMDILEHGAQPQQEVEENVGSGDGEG